MRRLYHNRASVRNRGEDFLRKREIAQGGVMYPSDRPGLGIELDEEAAEAGLSAFLTGFGDVSPTWVQGLTLPTRLLERKGVKV